MSECPTEKFPTDMECAACGGRGCPECGETGSITLTRCARDQVPADAWLMLEAVLQAEERHLPPVAGGSLDQTPAFMAAWRFINNEVATWRQPRR